MGLAVREPGEDTEPAAEIPRALSAPRQLIAH